VIAASVVFKRGDYKELTSYKRLLVKIEKLLVLCSEHNIEVVVFPALLGCLFNSGEKYISDITELSSIYKGVAVCPGSYYEADSGKTYHSSCIIMNGRNLLKQRQIYLAKWEKNIGLSRGIEVKSIDIDGMKLGIIISTDVFYPQVSRAFAMSGVELVLSPVAVRGKENTTRQLAGLWQNVQSNLFFGVESGFTGSYSGYEFRSCSIIHAPLEMTEKEDGFLAFESKSQDNQIILAELDNEKRKEAVKKFNTLAQLNVEAYKDILLAPGSGGCHE
jgi:predicted amidohydrolase